MGIEARDHGQAAGATGAFLILQPVDLALPGAETAVLQYLECLISILGELPLAMCFYVRWYKQYLPSILPFFSFYHFSH